MYIGNYKFFVDTYPFKRFSFVLCLDGKYLEIVFYKAVLVVYRRDG